MRLALLAFLLLASTAHAADLKLAYENPKYQAPGCVEDSTRPESTLALTRWYATRFHDGDTLSLGDKPAAGKEAQTDSVLFSFLDGTMGTVWCYTYDAASNRSCGYSSYVFAFPAVAPPPASAGLRARYSDNMDFSGDTLVVVDSLVNFQCGNWPMSVAPIPSGTIGPGHFAVRWTGFVTLPTAGTWGFCVNSDDGARFWIDGLKLVDRWFTGPAPIEACGTAGLSAGIHAIQLDYYQDGGPCGVTLSWVPPSQAEAIVPASALSH